MKALKTILSIILVVIMAGCLTYLGIEYYGSKVAQSDFAELTSLPKTTEKGTIIDRDKRLKTKNSSYKGWLQIEDSNISYPVVQCGDNEYYLKHNFYKQYSRYGCPFVDYKCNSKSFNTIIYGHHFQGDNRIMFGGLERMYKNKEDSVKYQNLIYQKKEYAYVGCLYQNSNSNLPNSKYAFNTIINNEKDFETYYNDLSKNFLYPTSKGVINNKKLLLLSTCSYGAEDQRFICVFTEV